MSNNPLELTIKNVTQHNCTDEGITCTHISSGTQYSDGVITIETDDLQINGLHIDLHSHHDTPYILTLNTTEQFYSSPTDTDVNNITQDLIINIS